MAISEHFGNPKGAAGRLMLSAMNIGHAPMARWGLARLTVPQDGAIADIGCGGGANVKRLLGRSARARVYGVDISEASVEKSRRANRKHLGSRCEIFLGSAESLPFSDGSLDLVTAFETVYFWKNIAVCFCEIRRVLKPGGAFAVINDPGCPDRHWERVIAGMRAYTSAEIAGAMKAAGFSDIKIASRKSICCVTGIA